MLGIGVAPGIAIARASKARRRIGVLEMGTPDPPELLWKEAAPLRALGWAEGNNLQVERRYGNGQLEALQPLAEELVRAQVEIIETWGAPATLAAKRATATIPIVFATAQDPVLHGLVESLARPGGNVTGYAANSVGVTAKCLSLLKELLPLLKRVGVLWQSEYAIRASRAEIEDACQSLRLQPVFVNFSAAVEIAPAIAASAREGAQALVVMQDGFAWSHRFEILDTATKLGLPTISQDPEMAEAGALIA